MQLSIFITALAAAMASGSPLTERNAEPGTTLNKRGCFSGGDNWGAEKNYALSAAYNACLYGGLSSAGGVSYNQGTIRYVCTNLSSLKKVDFAIQKISAGSQVINVAECYDGLQKEINGCDNGGSTSYSNWKYTSDPNAGNCA